MTILFLMCGLLTGVAQDTLNVYTYGGSADDRCQQIIEKDGRVYLFGTTSSFGNGPTDGYVVEVDSNWKPVRSATFGEFDVDQINAAIPYKDGFLAVGVNNARMTGEFNGKIWMLDSNFSIQREVTADLGETTFFNNVELFGQSIVVSGYSVDKEKKSILLKYDANLKLLESMDFNPRKFGELTSMISLDEQLLCSFFPGEDDVPYGRLVWMNSNLEIEANKPLPDSVGRVRNMNYTHDSNLIMVGEKQDSITVDSQWVASISYFERQTKKFRWNTMFFFPIDCLIESVEGIELPDRSFTLVAKTDYLAFVEGYSVLATDLDSNGNKIIGSGFYYGSFEDDVPTDAILFEDSSIVIAGYSDGYGVGLDDFYVLELPKRSNLFVFSVTNYEDSLLKTLGVSDVKALESAPILINNYIPTSDQQNAQLMLVIDLKGVIVDRIWSNQTNHFESLNNGYYFIQGEDKIQRLLISR